MQLYPPGLWLIFWLMKIFMNAEWSIPQVGNLQTTWEPTIDSIDTHISMVLYWIDWWNWNCWHCCEVFSKTQPEYRNWKGCHNPSMCLLHVTSIWSVLTSLLVVKEVQTTPILPMKLFTSATPQHFLQTAVFWLMLVLPYVTPYPATRCHLAVSHPSHGAWMTAVAT